MAQARTSDPRLSKYTQCECRDYDEYIANKDIYDKYDVVYSARRNIGTSHYFTIYKQPKDLDDYDVAAIIDGYFFNVIRSGNTLDCWFD